MANPGQPATGTVAKDPVCGMNVNQATAKHHVNYAGKAYFFCCGHCAEKFQAEPEKYLAGQSKSPGLVTLGMPAAAHAHSASAGSNVKDPVCGMDVDPAQAKHKAEHAGRTYYFCSLPGRIPGEPIAVLLAARNSERRADGADRGWQAKGC
jgi:Cu+-exporting ATPase